MRASMINGAPCITALQKLNLCVGFYPLEAITEKELLAVYLAEGFSFL